MKKKIFVTWYNLPETLRNRLLLICERLNGFRYGEWAVGNAGIYEPEAIAVFRTRSTLYHDSTMPTLAEVMMTGIKVAVFPVGMKVNDIVFYEGG